MHDVDIMIDMSQFTAFTRYTAAPSTASRTSKYGSVSYAFMLISILIEIPVVPDAAPARSERWNARWGQRGKAPLTKKSTSRS